LWRRWRRKLPPQQRKPLVLDKEKLDFGQRKVGFGHRKLDFDHTIP